jgi:hypothetical protein
MDREAQALELLETDIRYILGNISSNMIVLALLIIYRRSYHMTELCSECHQSLSLERMTVHVSV